MAITDIHLIYFIKLWLRLHSENLRTLGRWKFIKQTLLSMLNRARREPCLAEAGDGGRRIYLKLDGFLDNHRF